MARRKFIMSVGFVCGGLMVLVRMAVSQAAETHTAPVPLGDDFYAHVFSYQPSFIGWAIGEETHANVQVSIQYPFLPFEVWGANPNSAFFGYKSGLYVAYTGRYDIYFQRTSAPLISRDHNPGFYFDFNRCFDQPLALNLGYFHDSNGQVITTRAQYLAAPEHAEDFVSRGWDYILVGAAYTLPWLDGSNQDSGFPYQPRGPLSKWVIDTPKADRWRLTLSAQALGFLDKQGFGIAWKEESVFWENVSVQPHRSDFDGLRVSIVLQNAYYRLADTIRTGYSFFHFTNDLSFTFRIAKWLPLSIQWHAGYGPDLSAYHIPSQHLLLGCELYGGDQ